MSLKSVGAIARPHKLVKLLKITSKPLSYNRFQIRKRTLNCNVTEGVATLHQELQI